MVWFLILSSFS